MTMDDVIFAIKAGAEPQAMVERWQAVNQSRLAALLVDLGSGYTPTKDQVGLLELATIVGGEQLCSLVGKGVDAKVAKNDQWLKDREIKKAAEEAASKEAAELPL